MDNCKIISHEHMCCNKVNNYGVCKRHFKHAYFFNNKKDKQIINYVRELVTTFKIWKSIYDQCIIMNIDTNVVYSFFFNEKIKNISNIVLKDYVKLFHYHLNKIKKLKKDMDPYLATNLYFAIESIILYPENKSYYIDLYSTCIKNFLD
jgi:hypothetical protein